MEEQNIQLQEEVKQYVASTGRWYKFFGILGIIGIVLMVMGAIIVFVAGNALSSADVMEMAGMPEGMAQMGGASMGIVYLICSLLYVPMVVYMLRGAQAAESAVALNSNEAAARFLLNTKSYWKFYGILSIVMICLMIMLFIVAIIAGAASVL